MKVQLRKPAMYGQAFDRRADGFLRQVQKEVPAGQADKIVAINMDTGEYVLGEDSGEALEKFSARWPDVMVFMCRVDGGPATTFYGK